MALKINDQVIDVKVREQFDGSLYVACSAERTASSPRGRSARVVLDGVTVLLPTSTTRPSSART